LCNCSNIWNHGSYYYAWEGKEGQWDGENLNLNERGALFIVLRLIWLVSEWCNIQAWWGQALLTTADVPAACRHNPGRRGNRNLLVFIHHLRSSLA
jgi:hypothetical protein